MKSTLENVREDESPNIDNTSAMMTLTEAAVQMGIHRTTAWKLNERGEFPVPILKIGGSRRVVRAHLQRFLKTGEKVTLPFDGEV
jgi:excisionase family DNA binding protein